MRRIFDLQGFVFINKMKTNVIMRRELDGMIIEQNSKDGMFNATSFLKQYSSNKNVRKDISDFLSLKKTKQYILAIQEAENIDTRKVVSIKRGGKKTEQGTLMHPYLFIDFAMWLNPTFKVKVIKFVYDNLIKFRNESGDNFNVLTASASKLITSPNQYKTLAKALNYIVFGKHLKGIRNMATEDQLKEMSDIQKKLAYAIDMNLIKTFDKLIQTLRESYVNKFNKGLNS